MISVEEVKKEKLRTGFTTGTSATAAAKAGLLAIINQASIESVDVKLPKGSFIKIPIQQCKCCGTKSNNQHRNPYKEPANNGNECGEFENDCSTYETA